MSNPLTADKAATSEGGLSVSTDDDMSTFAKTILESKYLKPGEKTWEDIAYRVAAEVVGPCFPDKVVPVAEAIANREFMPAGRQLANAGHSNMLNNCFAAETRIITRSGAVEIGDVAGTVQTILSRGKWVEAPINSFGIQELRKVTLRRSGLAKEVFATGTHRWLVNDRIVFTDDLAAGMVLDVEVANRHEVTPRQDAIQAGIVYGDGSRGKHACHLRLCGEKDELLRYFEGFTATTPPFAGGDPVVYGLPRDMKDAPCVGWSEATLLGWLMGYFAADGCVSTEGQVSMASTDVANMELVRDIANVLGIATYGICHQDRISNLTGKPSRLYSVRFDRSSLTEDFFLRAHHAERFASNPVKRRRLAWAVVSVEETDRVEEVYCATVEGTEEFALEDNIATSNCFLYRVEDSKEGIADFFRKGAITGMTGGGVGAVWSDLRPRGAKVRSNGGESTGPCAFMQSFNEIGRGVVNGGSRRMAIWAGLHWWHPDVFEFMALKDWDEYHTAAKAADYSAYAPMDMTNISIILDDDFFLAHSDEAHEQHEWAQRVYSTAVQKMLETGEPGFSVDLGENRYENLRNPCCEITSEDDSDVCCLGSVNMARIDTLERFTEVTELGTLFLLCSTLISEVPHEEVLETREKNRRLGLGLMGIYEWLVARGYKYEPNDELGEWLWEWEDVSTNYSVHYADALGVSRPKKVRAIAPTGTIGIIAETTTGIEPLFAAAYKRRYLDDGVWKFQYVVDATAQRLVDKYDLDPSQLETAYDLAQQPHRRLAMQAFVQGHTDHAISSTLNLPAFSEQHFSPEAFGDILLGFLPHLRGVTAYPDGARGGQPLTVVPYAEAKASEGIEFEEFGLDQSCVSGVCGI